MLPQAATGPQLQPCASAWQPLALHILYLLPPLAAQNMEYPSPHRGLPAVTALAEGLGQVVPVATACHLPLYAFEYLPAARGPFPLFLFSRPLHLLDPSSVASYPFGPALLPPDCQVTSLQFLSLSAEERKSNSSLVPPGPTSLQMGTSPSISFPQQGLEGKLAS